MFKKQLTIDGFPATLDIEDVLGAQSILKLRVHPFMSKSASPLATLKIQRHSNSTSVTYETSLRGSDSVFTDAQALSYAKASSAAIEQVMKWQSISQSMMDNTGDCAREFVSMAMDHCWGDIVLYTALIGNPLAKMSEHSSYNHNKNITEQSSNIASVFFRDPAFGVAKETFIKYLMDDDAELKSYSEHVQSQIRIMFNVLDKLPMCANSDTSSYMVAALLLERDNCLGYLDELEKQDPVFHNADDEEISSEDFMDELLATRPSLGN